MANGRSWIRLSYEAERRYMTKEKDEAASEETLRSRNG
jgi:hypothetical protein